MVHRLPHSMVVGLNIVVMKEKGEFKLRNTKMVQ